MKRLLVALLFSAVLPAHAHGLPPAVLQALQAARIPAASVAVVVQPVGAKSPALAHNAQAGMNPASVMKLLTTYAALELLGPAYTWKTAALAEAAPVDGRLTGNLYIKGSGDPKFAIEYFWALLRQLRVRGVSHIAGDVVLDRSAFDLPPAGASIDDKPWRPYNVEPDALLVNFRALRFTLLADRGELRVLQETPSAGLKVDNRIELVQGPCGEDWKDQISIRLMPENAGERLEFSGTYPAQCKEKPLSLAPLPPDAYVGGLFRALWQELGGTLAGRVRSGTVPAAARPLAEQESPALADIVRDINKFSNNVMARQLYLGLAGPSALPLQTEMARQRMGEWLGKHGLAGADLEIENGSGLSRRERISAGSLNRLLLDAWQSPVMPEFVSSLPIVGIDGTMKKRLQNSAASGRAHIKTGTLEGVKSAAGYALDVRGRVYAVTILINDARAQYGQAAIDTLLLWVAQHGQAAAAP